MSVVTPKEETHYFSAKCLHCFKSKVGNASSYSGQNAQLLTAYSFKFAIGYVDVAWQYDIIFNLRKESED